jgi:hypothetical protein
VPPTNKIVQLECNKISAKDFRQHFALPAQPVLLEQCSGVCTSNNWTLEDLAKEFSDTNGGTTWYLIMKLIYCIPLDDPFGMNEVLHKFCYNTGYCVVLTDNIVVAQADLVACGLFICEYITREPYFWSLSLAFNEVHLYFGVNPTKFNF